MAVRVHTNGTIQPDVIDYATADRWVWDAATLEIRQASTVVAEFHTSLILYVEKV